MSESEQVSVNDMPRYMRYLAQKRYVLHSFNFTETLHCLIYYIALLNKTNMFICKSLRQSWMFFSNTNVIVYISRSIRRGPAGSVRVFSTSAAVALA